MALTQASQDYITQQAREQFCYDLDITTKTHFIAYEGQPYSQSPEGDKDIYILPSYGGDGHYSIGYALINLHLIQEQSFLDGVLGILSLQKIDKAAKSAIVYSLAESEELVAYYF